MCIRFIEGGCVYTNKEAFIEAFKELGRVVVLAIIPILIDALSAGRVDWRVVMVASALAGLRFIDKYLHELAPEGEAKGLTRF
jgi:hypothetical protein